LISPWVTHATSAKSFSAYQHRDFLTTQAIQGFSVSYCKDNIPSTHPEISPLTSADFRSLPPTLVVASETELLSDDIRELIQKFQKSNVIVEWDMCPGMPHVFPLLYPLTGSLALKSLRNMAKFANGRFTSVSTPVPAKRRSNKAMQTQARMTGHNLK
jgi:acetyl esterase/lipase